MLKYDTKMRLSATECLGHSWFKNNENPKNTVPLSKSTIENMKSFKVIIMNDYARKKIN